MSQIIKIQAPAKVNLALDILGKRIDGYHDMKMINHSISLADELELIPGPPFDIITDDTSIPLEQNLITKAVTYLSQITGKPLDFKIKLNKNIPSRAGLGGGSSDAAAAIKLALAHWNLEADPNLLNAFALKIGSDVPYSLYNKMALVEGLGEKLDFFDSLEDVKVLIIDPEIPVSTKVAFEAVDNSNDLYHPDVYKVIELLENKDYKKLKNTAGNTFTPIITEEFPEIGQIIEKLYDNGAFYATMSGSGSTIVGYFDNKQEAERAEKDFKQYTTILADILN